MNYEELRALAKRRWKAASAHHDTRRTKRMFRRCHNDGTGNYGTDRAM